MDPFLGKSSLGKILVEKESVVAFYTKPRQKVKCLVVQE